MYLKQMEILGFKSFANKIVLKFHNGITGIVGPNGSGKSNIADAVRWVLGEQSAKTLRSGSMTDVIFSGTQTRKPLSYAYVAITFDNSDHTLPTDYEEVTVSRRVYRSGESEYLINGTIVRLRDVTELFLDTGIGKEGYSIIGQGQIDKILSGRSEERRELFDEAVGIVKYKKRKAESLKKLSEEEESLVRLEDILGELERQREPLQEQAQVAQDYLKKRERMKALDINAFLLESEQIASDDKRIDEDSSITASQLEEYYASAKEKKEQFHRLKEDTAAREQELEECREKRQSLDVLTQKRQGEIDLITEQLRYEKQSAEELRSRREETLSTLESHKADIKDASAALEDLNGQRERLSSEEKEAGQALSGIQEKALSIEKELSQLSGERERIESFKREHEASSVKNKALKEQLTLQRSQTAARLLMRREKSSNLDALIERAKAEKLVMDEDLEKLGGELAALQERKASTEKERERLKAELNEKSESYSVSHTRLESIKNIAERYEGLGNTVKHIMENPSLKAGVCGVVADLVSTDPRYETAIETALSGSLRNIIVDTEADAKRLIGHLKKNKLGRATFLPVSSVKPGPRRIPDLVFSERGVIGTADTLISCDPKYEGIFSYLLGKTIVMEKLDDAIPLERKYHQSLNIVTLEGDTIRVGGAMTGGAFRRSDNLLGRKRQIGELGDLCRSLQENLIEINAAMDRSSREREDLASQEREARERYSSLTVEIRNKEHDLSLLEERKADEAKAYRDIEEESESISRQIALMDEEQQASEEKLSELILEEGQLREKGASLMDKKAGLDTEREECEKNISSLRIELAAIQEKINAAAERLERFKESEESARKIIEEISEKSSSQEKERSDKKVRIEELISLNEAGKAEKEELSSRIKSLTAEKEQLDRKGQLIFDESESISEEISSLEKESLRLEQRRERNRERLSELTDYLWDQYEISRHEALEQRDESMEDLALIRDESKRISAEIRAMGSVNVNAIDEYREVEERYGFMSAQHDDLLCAKEKLLSIITDLDTGMRDQFDRGFKDIRREFDSAFKELFGGGGGQISLSDEEDILGSDIEIIASPPGKKLTNMMQMSGGEKSLTAIALLFAIQNLHPSPFCLLDEIEAALDDSNVDRFANYLGRLTDHTQFIVITHRRGTMNAADRLYGITMQEKGVSMLVSVNLVEEELE